MSEFRLPSSLTTPAGLGRIEAIRTKLEGISGWVWITLIVTVSAIGRGLASVHHESPRLFPDEYIYASLARSLSQGELAIRGTTELFPALVQPLLTAPLWLSGDIGVAYAATQWVHAVVMSLSAIPVYALSRQLGLPKWQGVMAGAITLALPIFLFSSFVTADAVALPLALAGVAVGVRALAAPTAGRQVAFLALAGLASLTRVQYVVLVPAFAAAAIVMTQGRPIRAVRRYALTTAVLLVPAIGALALGPRTVLGYYNGIFDLDVSMTGIGHWIAVDLMLTAYAAGWVLIPAALVGVAACLARPETPEQRAFGAITAALTVLLLVEAGLYASNGSGRFQERYLMSLLPLVPLAFCVGMRRLPTGRRWIIAVSAVLLAIPVAVPLSGYAVGSGSQDSPFLQGVSRLVGAFGDYGDASLSVALLASSLAALAMACARWPHRGTFVALTVALAVSVAGSVAATSFDHGVARAVRTQNLPPDASWVDHLAPGAAMLLAPGNSRPLAATHLFWNMSIDRVLVMAGSTGLDAFGSFPTTVTPDGRLSVDGKPLEGAVLVEEFGSTLNLANGRRLATTATSTLWRIDGEAQVETLAVGRYADGWLNRRAAVSAWPTASGAAEEMRTTLSLPRWATQPAVLKVTTDGTSRTIEVQPGTSTVLRVAMKPRGETRTWLRIVSGTLFDATRAVSVRSSRPTVVPVYAKR